MSPSSDPVTPRLVTAVIGAGPAGLLFAVVAGLRRKRIVRPDRWTIYVFDKRDEYMRTHRLRIDPKPYEKLQREISDPIFDRMMSFLEEESFSVPVNELERCLVGALDELGLRKMRLTIGNDAAKGEHTPDSLRALLRNNGSLGPNDVFTIVGADSVHSAVREFVREDIPIVTTSFQQVARLRITGKDLPKKISPIETYKVSKALGSVVDFRSNRNGYTEADLLLDAETVGKIAYLEARPDRPVELGFRELAFIGSPYIARVVEHFRTTNGPNHVALQSTFRLEHQYIERVAYLDRPNNSAVFLVGDAAVSLPFFRGMACLAASVDHLARVHHDLADSLGSLRLAEHPNSASTIASALGQAVETYDGLAREVRTAELATVERRARAVRGAREFARVSSLVPFPLQTFVLSLNKGRDPSRPRLPPPTTTDWFNALIAGIAVLLFLPAMLAQLFVGPAAWTWLTWLSWAAALGVQVFGGFTFRRSEEFSLLRSRARRVWLTQISLLFGIGACAVVWAAAMSSRQINVIGAITWFIAGLVFIPGLLLAERSAEQSGES